MYKIIFLANNIMFKSEIESYNVYQKTKGNIECYYLTFDCKRSTGT